MLPPSLPAFLSCRQSCSSVLFHRSRIYDLDRTVYPSLQNHLLVFGDRFYVDRPKGGFGSIVFWPCLVALNFTNAPQVNLYREPIQAPPVKASRNVARTLQLKGPPNPIPAICCASLMLVQSTNTSTHEQRKGERGADFLLVFAGDTRVTHGLVRILSTNAACKPRFKSNYVVPLLRAMENIRRSESVRRSGNLICNSIWPTSA